MNPPNLLLRGNGTGWMQRQSFPDIRSVAQDSALCAELIIYKLSAMNACAMSHQKSPECDGPGFVVPFVVTKHPAPTVRHLSAGDPHPTASCKPFSCGSQFSKLLWWHPGRVGLLPATALLHGKVPMHAEDGNGLSVLASASAAGSEGPNLSFCRSCSDWMRQALHCSWQSQTLP
jgi:hypothetical protein